MRSDGRMLLAGAALAAALALGCGSSGGGGHDYGAADAPGDTAGSDPGPGETGADPGPGDTPGADAVALTCDYYCNADLAVCTGPNAQWASLADCMTGCASFPVGTLADEAGNTLGCRINHVINASQSPAAATLHCPHTGPTGDSVCSG